MLVIVDVTHPQRVSLSQSNPKPNLFLNLQLIICHSCVGAEKNATTGKPTVKCNFPSLVSKICSNMSMSHEIYFSFEHTHTHIAYHPASDKIIAKLEVPARLTALQHLNLTSVEK